MSHVYFSVRSSIRENVDLIRLQKQLSEKSTALRVMEEKFNNLQEVMCPLLSSEHLFHLNPFLGMYQYQNLTVPKIPHSIIILFSTQL